jgi:hypothetical protein
MEFVLTIFPYLIGAACLAVAATLFTGMGGMAQGGEFNRRNGNRMMRWRVGLQAFALLLMLLYALLRKFAG